MKALFGFAAIVVAALAAPLFSAAGPAPAHSVLVWTDIDGRGYGPVQLKANAATVLVFFSTQCPISNAYMGRVRDLEQQYFDKHVRFFLVNDHPTDTYGLMRAYARERRLAAPLVKEVDGALVQQLGIKVTSEAVVLDREGVVKYRGPIDDNKDPGLVHEHTLAQALDAVLAGGAIAQPWPKAQGCFIDRPAPAMLKVKAPYTYARDVAPILNKQCVDCHRPGQVAPFALVSYADARMWARQIKDVTQRRLMPPWKAEPGYGEFQNCIALSQKERTILAQWCDSGAPGGNLAAAPKPPHFSDDWPLGKPDLVLRPVGPYHLAADGRDVYRCFVLPAKFTQDAYVDFCQFKPANRSVVHHIILYVDPTGQSVKAAGADPLAAFDNPKAGAGSPVDGSQPIDGWAPGTLPLRSPVGFASKIPKGSRLILEVHYHRSGRPEQDCSEVGLTFARSQIAKIWDGGLVIQPSLQLPAGESNIAVKAKTTLYEDVTLYNIGPHMHQIGKEMHVWATTPDSKKKELIWLKDWDFNWQTGYNFREPIRLPKGTVVEMTALFDNADSNPRNPNRPPKKITWGEQTTDEMCIAFLGWTLDKQHLQIPAPKWEECVELSPASGVGGAAPVESRRASQ